MPTASLALRPTRSAPATSQVGSYCGECIYSFDVAAHARDVDALLHIPETVLR